VAVAHTERVPADDAGRADCASACQNGREECFMVAQISKDAAGAGAAKLLGARAHANPDKPPAQLARCLQVP